MSSKRQKIEAEILKFRNEGSWNKVKEVTTTLSNKYGTTDGVVMLLESEVQLRLYFEENPPRHENVSKARKDLALLKAKLQDCVVSEVKDTIFDVVYESEILTCLLLYAQGKTKSCIELFTNTVLDIPRDNMQCYQVRFMGEAYGIKGLCLEQTAMKKSEYSMDDIIKCYDRSTELCFSYISLYTELFNYHPPLGYVLEQSLQRGPLLQLNRGEIDASISKLRRIMTSKSTSSIHQKVARDLASVLLRGFSEQSYFMPLSPQHGESTTKSDKKVKGARSGNTSPTTATFSISPIDKPFSPLDLTQEVLLLLLLAEAILNTDPILDMSSEYAGMRQELLKDSTTLYNLLAVVVSDRALYDTFAKTVESSLKYTFDEFHLWYQYALSLLSAGRIDKAIAALCECSRISPDNPMPYLLCAKAYISKLEDFSSGLTYAEKALQAASTLKDYDQNSEDYLSESHVCVGLAHSMLCKSGMSMVTLKEHRNNAMLHFSEAHNIDPHDIRPLLFLAVELALDRRISEAISRVNQALELQPYDLNCLHLTVLLLSAKKQYKEAFSVLDSAIKFYPENINLLLVKCKLQLFVGKREDALSTCNHMTNIFIALKEQQASGNLDPETMLERMTSDGMSVTNQSIGNDLDAIDASSAVGSTVISRFERTLSDVEPVSCDSTYPQSISINNLNPSCIHGYLWLLTAEIYASLKRYEEAAQCIQESSVFFSLSYEILYAKGRLAKHRGYFNEAITFYENCISTNPKHHKAMAEWAEILIDQENFEFAKKLLQDAVRLNPWSHELWLSLGDVLQALGDIEGAVDCISTSIDVESTSPVLPFTSVSRDLI